MWRGKSLKWDAASKQYMGEHNGKDYRISSVVEPEATWWLATLKVEYEEENMIITNKIVGGNPKHALESALTRIILMLTMLKNVQDTPIEDKFENILL